MIRGQERLYLLQVKVLLVAVLVTHVEELFALEETGADARDFVSSSSLPLLRSIVAVTVVAVGLVHVAVAISAVCTLSGAARGVPVLSPRGSGGAGVGSRRPKLVCLPKLFTYNTLRNQL